MSAHDSLVLILNRSPDTLVLLRDVVQESGRAAVTRNLGEFEGDELLEFIAAHRPDVILFDVSWPYDTNLDAFRALRTDPRASGCGCGWVALSTSATVVDALREGGNCAVLGKPFDIENLMEAIATALETSGSAPGTPSPTADTME